MKKERIAKSIDDFKKNIGKAITKFSFPIILSISSIMPIISCKDPIPSPTPLENKAPETYITTNIKDDGKVEYTFSGTDEDGYVDYISANINGIPQTISNNSTISVPIIEGNNNVEARAYDNEGLNDSTPATNSFNSPTEEEASDLIENTLNPSTYNSLEKNALISLGASDSFYVNALIEKLNNTDAVIDYMGTPSNKQLLDLYGIPNLYIDRTSVGEIERKVLDFQENDYNN